MNIVFLVWIILVKMLPPVVLAVPLYDMFAKMKLLNNLWGLILVFQVYTLPYCVWMLFGFVKALPLEFEEAAELDGASRFQILRLIALPLVRTGLAATAIFCIIVAWDEFLFTMLFIRSPDLLTLPLVIANYIGEFETLWGQLMGIGMLATLPVIVFARVVYRQMTSAYSLGSNEGESVAAENRPRGLLGTSQQPGILVADFPRRPISRARQRSTVTNPPCYHDHLFHQRLGSIKSIARLGPMFPVVRTGRSICG